MTKESLNRINEHLDSIENRWDDEIRNLRTQVDLLTRLVLDQPFASAEAVQNAPTKMEGRVIPFPFSANRVSKQQQRKR